MLGRKTEQGLTRVLILYLSRLGKFAQNVRRTHITLLLCILTKFWENSLSPDPPIRTFKKMHFRGQMMTEVKCDLRFEISDLNYVHMVTLSSNASVR